MPSMGKPGDPVPMGISIALIIIFLAILGTGILFYQWQEQQITGQVTGDLTSIGSLKSGQITAWRNERIGDATVLSQNRFFTGGVKEYLASPDPGNRGKILELFDQLNTSYRYRNVMLTDTTGRVLISLDPAVTALGPELNSSLRESLVTRNAVMTDILADPDKTSPHMYAIAPLAESVNGTGDTIGAVILTIDPHDFLYPLIQSWPVESHSAETLLIEREGDHVLYLNELRNQNNTALNLTVPLSRTDVPAVRAVQGVTGVFTGKDYRGVDVVSVLGPVPGSPWFIVAKIDNAEAYAAWNTRAILIITLVAGLLAVFLLVLGLVWQRRQKYYFRTLHESEAEAAEAQHQYRETFENITIGILRSTPGPEGSLIDANPAALRIFEAGSREQLLAVPARDLYADAGERRKISDEILARDAIHGMEVRYRTLKGRVFWGRITAIKKIALDGKVYFYNTIEDISDRKHAENTLRETAEYLNKLIDFASAPIIVWDPAFRITRFNHAFERLTGRTEQEVLGQRLEILFPEESRDESFALIRESIKARRLESVRIPILGSDGSVRTVLWNSANILTAEADLVSTIAQGVDITESERAEVQREALIRELEQKNAELERFTYTVSHDLKSPLITIKGFAGLIEDDVQNGDPVQLKTDIRRIMTAADTMQELLSDVLELSRIGRVIAPPEKTSFGIIVHEAVDLLAGPLAGRGARVEIAPDLPDVVVDHARIREVVVNLIENAVKFSGGQKEPLIRIGVDMTGKTPVFFVQDNGIGIDPRYLERIFNLFERLDQTSPGTGVGLTITRRIIELHGGKIWAESEGPGKGTTFRFTLPGPAEDRQ